DETRNLFVERDHGPPAEGAARFHTTRWTIVMRAALSQVQWRQSALAGWCRLYYYPLYIFARRHGYSPAEIFGHQPGGLQSSAAAVSPGATLFLPGAPLVPRRQGNWRPPGNRPAMAPGAGVRREDPCVFAKR